MFLAIGFTTLAPGLLAADTVLGSATLDTVLLPGPNARKHLGDDALKEIDDRFAEQQKENSSDTGQAGGIGGDVVGIEIVRVQTRGGNDPLNINNPTAGGDTTGRTSTTTVATGTGGGTGGGGTITCTPSSAGFPDLSLAGGPNFLDASMSLNLAAGGSCVALSTTNGNAMFFSTPPGGSPPGTAPGQIEVFAAGYGGMGWSFVLPSPPGGSVTFASGTTQSFFLQDNGSGQKVKVIVNVTQTGPRIFTLNVISVTRI